MKTVDQYLADAHSHISTSDFDRAEAAFQSALADAESRYGALSGEVGLVLLPMTKYYESRKKFERCFSIDRRIKNIIEFYQL